MTSAHNLGFVFGDRWTPNTIIKPDGDFTELDFDIELLSDHTTITSFELSQTLYHLIHFSRGKRRFMKGLIKSLKGYGLIRGVEIVNTSDDYDQEKTKKLQLKLLYNGVLVRHHQYTLIFKPPIVITDEEMEKGFNKIKKIFKKYI